MARTQETKCTLGNQKLTYRQEFTTYEVSAPIQNGRLLSASTNEGNILACPLLDAVTQ